MLQLVAQCQDVAQDILERLQRQQRHAAAVLQQQQAAELHERLQRQQAEELLQQQEAAELLQRQLAQGVLEPSEEDLPLEEATASAASASAASVRPPTVLPADAYSSGIKSPIMSPVTGLMSPVAQQVCERGGRLLSTPTHTSIHLPVSMHPDLLSRRCPI